MRKFYLFASLLALSAANAQVIIDDDFEGYPVGSYFGGHWSNWSGTSGSENIIISTDQAASGTKSGYISNDGIQDAVLQFGSEYFVGTYTLQMKMYVPSDGGAYTNIQELSDIGSGNFANVFTFNYTPTSTPSSTPGKAYAVGTDYYYPFDIPNDEWFTFQVVIDLDNFVIVPTVNGTFTYNGADPGYGDIPYAGDYYSIAAYDMYSYVSGAAVTKFYVDDVVFAEGALAVNDVNAKSFSVYPTVVDNQTFNVSGKTKISTVEVYNMAGQQVLKLAPNALSAEVNASRLTPGTYIVKVIGEKETLSKKIIVK